MSFIFSVLTLWGVGALFILLVIRRGKYGYSLTEFLSLSFFLGAGIIAYEFVTFHLLSISFHLSNLVLVPLVLFVLVFAHYAARPYRVKELAPIKEARRTWTLTEWLLLAGIIIQLAWIVMQVIPYPVHAHDAVANYALKAKMFYFSGGIPEGFFSLPEETVSHPDYPLLLPLVMTWVYSFTAFNDLIVNMIMPVVYVAFILLVFSQLRRIFSRPIALLASFFLATIPQLADYAVIIHADLVLTAFITCAFLYFVQYLRERGRIELMLASALFAFSLWVKNEAIVFTASFLAAFFVLALRSDEKGRVFKDIAISVAVIAILASPWIYLKFTSGTSANSDLDIASLTFSKLLQNVKDIPIMLNLFQQEVFGPKKWNIFWPILFGAMVWKRKSLWKDECFYITLFLSLSTLAYFCAYMATTGQNLFFYVNTTISRFMLHFSGIALVLIVFLMHDDVENISSFKERS